MVPANQQPLVLSVPSRKTEGTVEIFGHNLDTHPSLAKQQLGVVLKNLTLDSLKKAFDILVTQAGYYGIHKKIAEKRAEHYLEKLASGKNAIYKHVCYQVV